MMFYWLECVNQTVGGRLSSVKAKTEAGLFAGLLLQWKPIEQKVEMVL